MKKRAWLSSLLALLAASGCGQKDPVDQEGGTAADYFPLRDGARFEYLHSNGQWTETVTFEATSEGRFRMTSSPDPGGVSEVQTLLERDGEVLRVAQEVLNAGVLSLSVEYDPGFIRFSHAWLDEEPGFTQRYAYERTETPAGGVADPPRARAHVYRVESLSETVTVPAGTFRRCIQFWRMRDYEVMAGDAGVIAEDQEKLYWFCPGVGKVREQNMNGAFEVLSDYDLPES